MMFSNDKNVETIGQLIEVLKHYIGLQSEYLKLDVVDKVVRLLTVITMTVVLLRKVHIRRHMRRLSSRNSRQLRLLLLRNQL